MEEVNEHTSLSGSTSKSNSDAGLEISTLNDLSISKPKLSISKVNLSTSNCKLDKT